MQIFSVWLIFTLDVNVQDHQGFLLLEMCLRMLRITCIFSDVCRSAVKQSSTLHTTWREVWADACLLLTNERGRS